MKYIKGIIFVGFAFVMIFSYTFSKAKTAPEPPAMFSKGCLNCHQNFKSMKDTMAGNFRSRSNKAKSIQLKINNRMELVKFNSKTVVKNVPNIKALKEPIPIRVHYKKVGSDLVATEIVAKPKMKVPEKQLMSTEELGKLVAQGPEKGNFTLVDSRPGIKYAEGHIPGAISIPFPKMKQSMDKLPKDKNQLLIFYCEGMR